MATERHFGAEIARMTANGASNGITDEILKLTPPSEQQSGESYGVRW